MNIVSRGVVNGRPTWRLRWETKDPGTGKRRYEYQTFHGPKREAERRWIAHEAEIGAAGAGYVKPERQPLADYLRGWIRDYGAAHLKATTVASYRTLAEKHIIPALGAVPLADLTASHVSTWQADMLRKAARRGRPPKDSTSTSPEDQRPLLSPKRVANARMMLHTALQEAVRLGVLPTNPVTRVRPPKQNPTKVEGFTLGQVQALAAATNDHRLHALFLCAWQTGMRMGELLALRWEDLNLPEGTARVVRTAASTGGAVFMQDPKTAASIRTVVVPEQAVAALRTHRARQAEERLRAGAAWKDHALVFPTSKGTPILPTSLEKTWHVVRERAALPAGGFHSLRHTYASLALSAGVPLEMVSENLGHKNPGFTKRVYAAYLLDAKRAAADRLTAFLAAGAAAPGGTR